MYPRPEDVDRLRRYEQARRLYQGEHQDSAAAKRIADKLSNSRQFTRWQGYSAEGTVWLVYNLPRLIVTKFADLQVLNAPIVQLDDDAQLEALQDGLREGTPDLWARIHYAKQLQRAYGDAVLTVSKGIDNGPVDVRVVDPMKWFPVIDENDPLHVLAHQIAWMEDHDEGKESVPYLRVDLCYPDRIERRAFKLKSKSNEHDTGHEIEEQVPLARHWGELPEVDEADIGGLMSCVHVPNACLRPGEIWGRPEFYDSNALIDDVNWRLSTWSDANDRVAHAPEIIDKSWLGQDEDGTVLVPSQYTRRFVSSSGRSADAHLPQYMQYPLEHETLKEQFEASVLALLIRHEMSPGLLGLQFGKERESGEAKSLSMGTTEAATRRDLLTSQPRIDQALTVAARLMGMRDAEVSTHWRVGLPKTQAELMQELQQLSMMGLVTRRDMLKRLYPWLPDDQVDAKLAELDEERQAELDAAQPEFSARQG